MPSLGADMESGTLIQWLVKLGDAVKRGDIIAVVDTEKAAIEIEVFEPGVIHSFVVHEGEQVPVGAVLAIIRRDGEVISAPPPPQEAPAKVVTPPSPAVPPPVVAVTPPPPRVAKPAPLKVTPPSGNGGKLRLVVEQSLQSR